MSFPMHPPVKKLKQCVQERIDTGEICLGESIVTTTYPRHIARDGEIIEESVEVSARKVPLHKIRRRLLEKHENLGVIRQHSDEYYNTLSTEEIKKILIELHERVELNLTIEELRDKLKKINRTRHLKLWHDHSEIAGHSYLLVLVAAVYDPAFYYTTEEMYGRGTNIDVPTDVEDPQIHILGKSTSSLKDQAQFSEKRRECLASLNLDLRTKSGIPVTDVMRFFHGDGPAMQFEAGNKIGGYYCCVGCDSQSTRFDDLVYCFHAHRLSLSERQQFILKGEAWKHSKINPLSNLKVSQLRKELEKHGVNIKNKKKIQLQQMENLQKGISNVPAILLSSPQISLQSINLESYEVFPTEPLHDLKGHARNLIDEATKLAKGENLKVLKKIESTVLNKSTLRCSDYRKALIFIYNSLQ